MRAAPLLLALATSCAAARGFGTSPDEYALYRRTRVAEAPDHRLMAAARYLAEHPRGAWANEVRADFEALDERWFELKRKSPAGLRDYLAALPSGPHAARARELLEAAEAAARRRADLSQGREIEQRIAAAAERRKAVRGAVRGWLGALLHPDAFRVPLAKAPRELVVPWSLELPAPVCKRTSLGETSCFKLLDLPYEVQEDGGAEAREATLTVTLARSDAGVPVEAKLAGPNLFVRMEEAARARPVGDDAPSRARAAGEAAKLVREVFEGARPDASGCAVPARAPTVLALSCGGLTVAVVAGASPADDDFVSIAPVAGPR